MKDFIRNLEKKLRALEIWFRRKLSFIVLPGFDGMPLYDVLVFFFNGLFKGVLTYRAAAIAYNFFLALIPFILFLFTLIPFVTGDDYQAELLDLLSVVIPTNIHNLVQSTIVEIVSRPATGLLSVVFLTATYFATNGIDAILEGFNQSYHETNIWPWWKQKLRAFLLMTGLSGLVMTSIILLGFGKLGIRTLMKYELITHQFTLYTIVLLQWAVIVFSILLSISILYYFGQAKDREQNRYRFISAGSLLGTGLFVGGGLLLKMYFENFSRYNLVYGSIGSLILLLVWIYYNSIILLIGYELDTSIRSSKAELLSKKSEIE